MKIMRAGAPRSPFGPAETFTGPVSRDPLFSSAEPTNFVTGVVTFEPCSRTDWHTHPLGQILVVTAGCGWVQSWQEPKQVINAGDVVWTPPGEKHWHGATAETAMTHIAICQALNGSAVNWLEKVADADYMSPLARG